MNPEPQATLWVDPPADHEPPIPAWSPCGKGVVLYLDEEDHSLVAVPTLCCTWVCPRCGPVRVRQARAKARAGNPQRMITLTTRPRDGLSTEQSVKWFRHKFSLLVARIRRNFGPFEYFQATELHKSGWPHMHILTRGCYIPQRMLKAWWISLTGSFKVYIQKVKRTWKAVQEATKYCLKTARDLHKACPAVPVYTKSQGWLPDDWQEDTRPPGSLAFYAYVPAPWADFCEILESLNCDVENLPGSPGRFRVNSRGPPRQATLDAIYTLGSYADAAAASAIDTFFAAACEPQVSLLELQSRRDYAFRPWALPDATIQEALAAPGAPPSPAKHLSPASFHGWSQPFQL